MTVATAEHAATSTGWREHRVTDLCALTNGYPFDSELFSSSGDMPLVRIRDILGNEFETYLPADATPRWAEVANGDLVIGMDGDFNQTLWDRGRAALNQRVCLLRPRRGTDIRFIHYALPGHLKVINDLTYSTTVKHLSSGQILAIRLLAPVEGVQRQIADYLDWETGRIDALIAKQQQLSETLMERRKRVVDHYMVDGNVSGSSALPSKYLYRVRDERAGDRMWPLLSVSIHGGVRRRDGEITDEAKAEDLSTYKIVRRGDIVLNRMRAFQGASGEAPIDGIVSPDYLVLVPGQMISSSWLAAVFKSSWMIGQMTSRLRGIGSTESGMIRTPRINSGDLGVIRLPVPSLKQQDAAVAQLCDEFGRINRLMEKVEVATALLRERRQALISAAVTGKIDVRGM